MNETKEKPKILEFDWDGFTEADLKRMNKEQHPDGYGRIHIKKQGQICYMVDVMWETKDSYGRDGISLELYETSDSLSHEGWIDSLKEINTAKDYKRFKTRVMKAITKTIGEWEE